MSFNLLDSAKGLITNELVKKASIFLGESESGVAKAISGILPSIVGGIIDKASTKEGANEVVNLSLKAHSTGFLNNSGDFFSGDSSLLNKGIGLLSGLFGDNKNGILSGLIANFSGIKNSSATSLLSMAAPLVLGLLGKHTTDKNLQGSDVASLLKDQKSGLMNAIPGGLNLNNLFNGFSGPSTHTTRNSNARYVAEESTGKSSGSGLKWLLPLLLLLLAGVAAYYLFGKGCSSDNALANGIDSLGTKTKEVAGDIKDAITTTAGKVDSITGDWWYEAGKDVTIDLPNSAGKLVVGENSTENKLYKFLSNSDAKIDTLKGNWFEFTNVHFKTGGSQLDSTSMVQLKNMVLITKAFPTAEFKLGGYTDNTGDSIMNIALSQKRAEAVVATLKKLGTSSFAITGAKGYGPQWPIADNATKEGQAQNRRVAVNVKAK